MNYCPKCGSQLITVEIDSRERRRCSAQSCNYTFWDNPTPVVAAIVEHQGAVILVRQKGWPEKWRGLVTGFLERGETPEEAVLRELSEELGLDGEIVSFVGYYTFTQANQLILAFHVQAQGDILLGDELESYQHVPPEKLRPWSLGTGPALRDWLARRGNALAGLSTGRNPQPVHPNLAVAARHPPRRVVVAPGARLPGLPGPGL